MNSTKPVPPAYFIPPDDPLYRRGEVWREGLVYARIDIVVLATKPSPSIVRSKSSRRQVRLMYLDGMVFAGKGDTRLVHIDRDAHGYYISFQDEIGAWGHSVTRALRVDGKLLRVGVGFDSLPPLPHGLDQTVQPRPLSVKDPADGKVIVFEPPKAFVPPRRD